MYSDYDELDCFSDVYGGVYCQLWHEIRPYGHYAPTDGELSHGMNDPANYMILGLGSYHRSPGVGW